jgi:glycosyltransferase involved in cell wall biosynthesis
MIQVSVAMTTYNGSTFLMQQLDSIASQDYLPCELVVCDDNSSDDTFVILTDFSRRAPFPVLIHRNSSNIGPIANFFKVMSLCSGDWISFCDQDDVWLKHKIHDVVDTVRKNPSCYCVFQYATLTTSSLTRYSVDYRFPRSNLYGTVCSNSLPLFFEWHGFLTSFNRSILSFLIPGQLPLNIYSSYGNQSHDQWVSFISRILGNCIFLPRTSAYYRRHSSAVTGLYANTPARQASLHDKLVYLKRHILCAASCRRYCLLVASLSSSLETEKLFRKAATHYSSYKKSLSIKYSILASKCLFSSIRSLFLLSYFEMRSILLNYPSSSFSMPKYLAFAIQRYAFSLHTPEI